MVMEPGNQFGKSATHPVPSIGNLTGILELNARLYPGEKAVVFDESSLTYHEFNLMVNQLAHYLAEQGAGPGSLVGIMMDRSAEMVVSIFAVLKTGAAYVPFDPSHPVERVRLLITDAGISIALTLPQYAAKMAECGCQTISPDLNSWNFSSCPAVNPAVSAGPDDLAYVLFTSGSTGQPKGVMVEHHSVLNLVSYIQSAYPLTVGDVVLFKSPYTFDGSVWELYGWLLPRAVLCIAPHGMEKDPGLLLKLLGEQRVSFTFFVSSMLSTFLEYIELSGKAPAGIKLRWVSVGGEVVPPSLVRRFYAVFNYPGTGLINVYGPTETTVYATTYLCPDAPSEKVPVGKAVAGDFIYILDERLESLLQGDEGEIYIGGEGVARGYLGRPELTAERFRENPFRPGEKLYATGDIGRLLPDGNLDFIGRRDFQVKLRGLRIELGEIEHALGRYPGIREAVMTFSKDRFGDDAIFAFMVPEPSLGIPAGEIPAKVSESLREALTGHLLSILPSYMVPSDFFTCRAMPLTANGKVNRAALVPPAEETGVTSPAGGFPLTPVEEWLLETWKEVLGLEEIGVEDNFFRLGGHSLKAAGIAARIAARSGSECPVRTIFENPTVRKLAGVLEAGFKSSGNKPETINRVSRTGKGYPLLPNQLELWFLHRMDVTGISHNILFRLEFTGNADPVIFRNAAGRLITAHETLRTAFRTVDGIPQQFVCDPWSPEMDVSDLSRLDNPAQEKAVEAVIGKMRSHRFDTASGRLLDLNWFVFSHNRHVALFSIHHLVFDGWSMFNFFAGLRDSYISISKGEDGAIVPPSIQNIDYAVFLGNSFSVSELNRQLAWWLGKFSTLPAPLVLAGRKRFDQESVARAGKRLWWRFGPGQTRLIREVCAANELSLFGFFLSVYKTALAFYSGNPDIVVGTPYANRSREETEQLIGYFTNMMALRDRIEPDERFLVLAARVLGNSLDAFAHAAIPFGAIVKELGLTTSPGKYPLFQAVFVMQNWAMPLMDGCGFLMSQCEIGSGGVKAELMLNAEETGEEIECWLEYDVSLYDMHTVSGLAESLQLLVNSIVDDNGISVGSLMETLDNRLSTPLNRRRVLLVGETSLLPSCGSLLSVHGFQISGVISPDPACRAWAHGCFVPLVAGYEALKAHGVPGDFEYIFSIVNSRILDADMLGRARIACINYHDSPLPWYAGVHATSWALLNGETMHGVSWHVMKEEADAGAIIASKQVRIDPGMTAGELNARCILAAVASFREVVERLLEEVPLPADTIPPRSWFGLHMKPRAGAMIDFRRTAAEICSLVNALDLGAHTDNRLALPRLAGRNGIICVTGAGIESRKISKLPGAVLQIGNGTMTVSAGDMPVTLAGLTTPEGLPLDRDDIRRQFGEENMLVQQEESFFITVENIAREYGPFEPFWIRKLSLMNHCGLHDDNCTESLEAAKILLPGLAPGDFEGFLLLFLMSYEPKPDFTVGLAGDNIARDSAACGGLFAAVVPLVIPEPGGEGSSACISVIKSHLDVARSKGSYPVDLIGRIGELKRKFNGSPPSFEFILAESDIVIEGLTGLHPESTYIIPGEGRVSVLSRRPLLLREFSRRLPLFLASYLANTDASVSRLHMLTPEEMNLNGKLCPDWDFGDVKPFFTRLKSCVVAYGEKTAIETDGEKITYRELKSRVDIIATSLSGRGLTGRIIGILMNRGPEFIISMLGILRSGNGWLPMEPALPDMRINAIAADSAIGHVITTPEHKVRVPGNIECLEFEELNRSIGSENQNQAVDETGRIPAYVIYTSGTTGTPKGVVTGRRSLDIFIHGCICRYGLTPADRVLQFAAMTFDASVEEIFPTLASGATLVVRSADSIASIGRFHDFCDEKKISVLDLPTAFWHRLVDGGREFPVPQAVRLVIIGGERASDRGLELWKSSGWNSKTLINTYGPTETTVVATAFSLVSGEEAVELPIGRPVFGTTVRLVNSLGQAGIPGHACQLWIGGGTLSEGYLNNPELTGKVFRNFGNGNDSARFYNSGDLAALLPDGNLVFRGRSDSQLKIRGFRVEPEEVRNALNRLPSITDSLVAPVGTRESEIRLVAWIVTNHDLAEDALQQMLADKLPPYMIPFRFIRIPFIPLTIHNKPDFSALPAPEVKSQGDEVSAAPETSTEKLVYCSWKKHLGMERFGIDDDFFRLGGHSLMALAIMSDLEMETGRAIPLASLFSYPTVKSLAAALDQERDKEAWRSLICIRKGTEGIPLFIIHGGGLNVLLFNTLVSGLSPMQTVYGIQAHGLDGKSKPYDNIDDIAGHYMSEIRNVRPNGPYALAGFSIGGLIAYEIACRFEEQGSAVAFLGMFDTEAWSKPDPAPFIKKLAGRFSDEIRHIAFNVRVVAADPVHVLPQKLKWIRKRIRMELMNEDAIHNQDLAGLPANLVHIAKANIAAVREMKLRPFHGNLHLFRAGRRNFYVRDPVFLGWKEFARDVIIHPIPGDHSLIFAPPHDTEFAAILQRCLDEIGNSPGHD